MTTEIRMQQPKYLGDGAWIQVSGDGVMFYTSNGVNVTNRVYIDIAEIKDLEDYLKEVRKLFT